MYAWSRARSAAALLLFCVLSLSVVAAAPSVGEPPPEVEPAWTLTFESQVDWQRVTPLGRLIVGTADGLCGVDPDNGDILWLHRHLGGLAEQSYTRISGTPFVMLAEGAEDPRVVVLNTMNGKVSFDSRKAGIARVLDAQILPHDGSLLVLGFPGGKPRSELYLFDVETGEKLWTNEKIVGAAAGGKLAGLLTSLVQATTGDSGIRSAPFEISDDAFLYASGTGFYRISTRTGEVEWYKSFVESRRTRFFMAPGNSDAFYVGAEWVSDGSATAGMVWAYYMAFRAEDGEALWDKPVKNRGGVGEAIFLDRGMVVGPPQHERGKLKLVDYASGKTSWGKKGKGIEVPGGVVDHDLSEAGLVLTTGVNSAWRDKLPDYSLNVLDVESGTFKLKKPVKIRGRLLGTDVLAGGVLYVTTSQANILDLESGKTVSPKAISSEESLVTAVDGTRVYVFSRDAGSLFEIDTEKSSVRKLGQERVKLDGSETPISLEVVEDRITLVSSQHVVGFDRQGAVELNAHHPAPRRSALMRALLTAQAIRAGMAAFAAGVYGGAFGHAATHQDEGSLNREISTGLAHGYGEMADGLARVSGQYLRAARERFEASATSRDFAFMMVQFSKQQYGLAQVSKDSGEILAIINMQRDREPVYQVDGISNRIYYRSDPSKIVAYAF